MSPTLRDDPKPLIFGSELIWTTVSVPVFAKVPPRQRVFTVSATNGKFQIQVFAAGEIVPAFGVVAAELLEVLAGPGHQRVLPRPHAT